MLQSYGKFNFENIAINFLFKVYTKWLKSINTLIMCIIYLRQYNVAVILHYSTFYITHVQLYLLIGCGSVVKTWG